jgi:hypothetical protein
MKCLQIARLQDLALNTPHRNSERGARLTLRVSVTPLAVHVAYIFNVCNNTLTSLSSNNTIFVKKNTFNLTTQYHSLIPI